MAGILVFVEQRNGEIRKTSLQAISQAKREGGAGGEVAAVLPGSGIADAAAGLGAWGADKVFVADDPNLALYSAEGYAEVVARAVELTSPSAVFFGGTAMGRDLAPRLAAKVGVGGLPDVVDLTADGESFSAVRPVYSGKANATATTAGKAPQVISLVAGGDLVMEAARTGKGELIPVDSEHSAILQCLEGYGMEPVSRLVLTASGGPFRGWTKERLQDVTPAHALNHPTWSMGAKITVDSATLANKALEVIEAHFLYGVAYDALDVVVHPQSIVHSFVEFVDGSVLAQLGFPTMELPILYALSYPERIEDGSLQTFDPVRASPLVFEEVDREAFTLFGLGERAGREGGTSPAVYNAANEVAVEAFLREALGFMEMGDVVAETLNRLGGRPVVSLEQVLDVDREARAVSGEMVRSAAGRSTRKTS